MADITVTAANVAPGTLATFDRTRNYGETVVAGQLCYVAADNDYMLTQNDANAIEAVLSGISVNGGADGQPAAVQTAGNVNPGGTVVVGEIYVVSSNQGGIAVEADNATQNDRVSIFGVGTSSSNIFMHVFNSGALIP